MIRFALTGFVGCRSAGMNTRERFLSVMDLKRPDDRLPVIEWAGWWDKTLDRWRSEGLPSDIGYDETREYLGLDMYRQYWIGPFHDKLPVSMNDKSIPLDPKKYAEMRKYLFSGDTTEKFRSRFEAVKPYHDRGDAVVWISLEGFFWFPRVLFGIRDHLLAFYDQPELMHQMNSDLADFNIRATEEMCGIMKPDFMTFAEDMSYNHGPMISRKLFTEFMLPYYKRVIPVLKKHGIIPIVDSDGQVEEMIPWLIEAGIEGVLPLERQAGVDIGRIRKDHPDFKMIGAFDKMVMGSGETAMRKEFERILPVMISGGYIPGCDHQTPPDVSLEDYMIYVRLLKEYCEKAVKQY
jgi:hypothetical protein